MRLIGARGSPPRRRAMARCFESAPNHDVRDDRPAGIQLGHEVAATGRPATDDQLVTVFNRHKVPAAARPDLVRLWRSIESG